MTDILSGFASVALIVLAGWFVGRSGILPKGGGAALNLVVFWVALPAMLIHTLATTDTSHVLGVPLAVAAISALASAVVYHVLARLLLGQKGAERVVGGMAASYNNVANLGVPIAAAVLGDPLVVVPALLFQIGLYSPATLTVLDVLTSRHGRIDWRSIILSPLRNPMALGAIGGLTLGHLPFAPPAVIMDPLEMLGHAAVPMALLTFGISMYGAPVLRRGVSPRKAVLLSSVLKLTAHPFFAWLAGVAFGLEGTALLAVVVVAALPTAQNVFTFSLRYGIGSVQARDSGFVTTLACVPVILLIAAVLG
ncbi:AEC family transporter [Corynebacterium sp. 335C]